MCVCRLKCAWCISAMRHSLFPPISCNLALSQRIHPWGVIKLIAFSLFISPFRKKQKTRKNLFSSIVGIKSFHRQFSKRILVRLLFATSSIVPLEWSMYLRYAFLTSVTWDGLFPYLCAIRFTNFHFLPHSPRNLWTNESECILSSFLPSDMAA